MALAGVALAHPSHFIYEVPIGRTMLAGSTFRQSPDGFTQLGSFQSQRIHFASPATAERKTFSRIQRWAVPRAGACHHRGRISTGPVPPGQAHHHLHPSSSSNFRSEGDSNCGRGGAGGGSTSGRVTSGPIRAVVQEREYDAIAAEIESKDEFAGSGFSLPFNELPAGSALLRQVVRAERGFNEFATVAVIKILDALYKKRPYARFYVLETIARVPYFAFLSVLHMYESFGWWRRADYLKVHFAQSWNELHHLLVMEALGGDEKWTDRFLAQHISVAYYFMSSVMYLISPRMAYHFAECVEKHAYLTYDKFLRGHGEELKKLPAPEVAVRYYTHGDLYMFDEFQTSHVPNDRRPKVDNLYDVFFNIREDEAEHCKTMRACQTPANITSPHNDAAAAAPSCSTDASVTESAQMMVPPAECNGIVECAVTASSYSARIKKSTAATTSTFKP